MRPSRQFNLEAFAVAATLKQLNPEGVNPIAKPGPCRDCGRWTRESYICKNCQADLAARRAAQCSR
jgi:hypothetical protein